jgi:hypothetical protein
MAPSPRPQRKRERPSRDTVWGTPKCSEIWLAPDVYTEEAKDLHESESGTWSRGAYKHVDAEKCWNAGHVDALPLRPVVRTIRIIRSPPVVRSRFLLHIAVRTMRWRCVGHAAVLLAMVARWSGVDNPSPLRRERNEDLAEARQQIPCECVNCREQEGTRDRGKEDRGKEDRGKEDRGNEGQPKRRQREGVYGDPYHVSPLAASGICQRRNSLLGSISGRGPFGQLVSIFPVTEFCLAEIYPEGIVQVLAGPRTGTNLGVRGSRGHCIIYKKLYA